MLAYLLMQCFASKVIRKQMKMNRNLKVAVSLQEKEETKIRSLKSSLMAIYIQDRLRMGFFMDKGTCSSKMVTLT